MLGNYSADNRTSWLLYLPYALEAQECSTGFAILKSLKPLLADIKSPTGCSGDAAAWIRGSFSREGQLASSQRSL